MDALKSIPLPGSGTMSAKRNVALIRHLYEEIDKGNEAVLEKVYASGFIKHDAASESPSPPGLSALKEGFARFAAAFPESEHIIEDIVAEGDKVVVRVTGRGVHRGEYLGVAPTGKRVRMSGIAIYRIAGGKIVEEWSVSDRLTFHRQLGLIE